MKPVSERRFYSIGIGDDDLIRLLLDRGAIPADADVPDLRVHAAHYDEERHELRITLEGDSLPRQLAYRGYRGYFPIHQPRIPVDPFGISPCGHALDK